MIKKLMMFVVATMAAILSYGSLLSEWYADHHDNPLEWVIVGREAVETKNISGGYRFQTADAELVNTAYGWELVLGHNEIYGCGIKAEGDLIIRLKAGMRTLITPVEDGGLNRFSPTGYKASTSDRVFGIKSDSLLIYGPGELVVMHMAVDAYDTGRGINCWGSELKISNGAMLRVESAQEDAIDGVSAQLSIVNAVLETRGRVFTRGKIQVDHSIVNIMSQGTALESWEKISIKDSCCSFIAKKGVALGVRGLLETDESIIYAYSQNNHCVVSSYDASSKSGYGCVFGKGFYRFATNGGEGYAAIDSGDSYCNVAVNGATIETCAPGGTGIDMTLPRLTMNSGLIRHRNSMDFKKDFLVGRELLDAYGLLISWNSVGIELGYSPEKVIGVFLGETLVNWLQKQSIDNPKGKSLRNIRGKITLNDGTIISEESEKGIYGDDLWGGVIHIIKGGSLQGPIWPAPVDTNGNELACVTNVISNGTAYEQVTSGWTAKLPKGYNTSSLVVDGEKKLYFWVSPDIGFHKPDEWSSPFFVTSDPDGTKPMSRINLGEPVYLKYGFKNLAGHAGMKGFFNSFTLNGETSFTNGWKYSTLKAGEWGWGGAYWRPTELQNLPQGTYTLKCELDVTDVLKNEANERDNSRTITFTIGPASCTVTFNPNGGTVSPTTRSVVKGTAVGILPTPSYSGYIFDGWYTASNGGTKISSSSIITQNITLYAHWKRQVEAKPDLVVSSAYVSKTQISFSGSVTVTCRILNKGTAPAYMSYTKLSYSEEYLTATCSSLAPGREYTQTFSLSGQDLGVGTHTLILNSDGLKVVDESNEDNNTRSVTVTVLPPQSDPGAGGDWAYHKGTTSDPDSFYLSSSVSEKKSRFVFEQGQPIYVYVGFWNAKGVSSSGEVRLRLSLNTGVSSWWRWNSPGKNVTCVLLESTRKASFLQDLPPGSYTLTSVLDYSNSWTESNEENNIRKITFTVKAKAPSTYTIRFIRNEGSGYISNKTFKYGTKTRIPSLNSLGWARRGYTFKGWATSTANARNGKIWKKDWAYVSTAATAGKTLTVYAVWSLKSGYYSIRFNKNDGTGKWRELGYKYGDNTTLPTIANGLQWSRAGYTFGGWATSAANAAKGIVWRGDKGVTRTPIAAGKTLNVYAIWKRTGATVAAVNAFTQKPMSYASLPYSGVAEPARLQPGYYSGELADGTGTYDLLVDEDGETGYVHILFDDGSVVSGEVNVDIIGDIILVVNKNGELCQLRYNKVCVDDVIVQDCLLEVDD